MKTLALTEEQFNTIYQSLRDMESVLKITMHLTSIPFIEGHIDPNLNLNIECVEYLKRIDNTIKALKPTSEASLR